MSKPNIPTSENGEIQYEFTLPMAWEVVKGTHPGIKNAVDATESLSKVIDQGQPINALKDAGRGVMSGLADTTGSIADVGGLLPNRVADMAHDSADWWRDQYEIVDSEAGNIGTNVGSEAVAGVTGGVIGKGLGTATGAVKKLNTLKGAKYDRHIRKVAKNAGEIAREFKPRGKSPSKYNADMVEANAYHNLQKRDTPKLFSAVPGYGDSSLLSKAIENMKYPFTGRGSLERNNLGLESLFNQGHSLKDAQKILHSRFAQYPAQYGKQGQNIGAATGVLMGTNGGSDNDIVSTPKPYRNRRDIQLEGGMPDYDSVMNMSDAEFNEYDRKYLGGAGLP